MTIHRASDTAGHILWQGTADGYQGMNFYPGKYLRPTDSVVVLEVGQPQGDGTYEWHVLGVQQPMTDAQIEAVIQQRSADTGIPVETIRAQSILHTGKE